MTGLPWWPWAIAAALLAVAELHWPGAYLIWVALGAALTSGAVAPGLAVTLDAQFLAFAVAAAASCVTGWFVYRALPRPANDGANLNQRAAQLVGARGVVSEALRHGQGKVRIGDSQWLAEGPDLAVGDAVVIAAARGTRLVVRPA